jgi:type VI secretion system protein ImpC
MSEQAGKSSAKETVAAGNLLDDLLATSRLSGSAEAVDMATQGLSAFVNELLAPQRQGEKISGALIDDMIAQIDAKVSRQLDAILHDAAFQQLESSWRSLKYLVDSTDFRQNNKICILHVTKDELREDFEDAPEIVKSALYQKVYTDEYGQFGGQPYGSIIGNFQFGPGSQDIALLQNIASVSAMAHAPFISAAGPQFFGVDSYEGIPGLKDLHAVFDSPQYTKWRSFRESEDARYVGLTAPRFLLRAPYGADAQAKSFNYTETVGTDNGNFLWGNAAFTFAANMNKSFAEYRWCANIIGPQGGGAVENLPVYHYDVMGELQTKIPTEVLISERREFEMAEEGFIALSMRKGSDNAAFFSANSCQKTKTFANTPEGKAAETNAKLGAQLPYLFVISRLSHYIKMLQRENIGSWKERGELETELNKWLSQYVADVENPSAEVKSKRPLREAKITVSSVEGEPGWYRVEMHVRPHFKYMGVSFSLSLVGKLDKQ